MIKYIETERLILRSWEKDDLQPFEEMNANDKVMEYFPNLLSKDESIDLYNRIRSEFEEFGYGAYAVETKEDQRFIGYVGFHKATFVSDFTPCIEIAWRLRDTAWGKGYATEAAKACLDYGFKVLGFDEIYSFTAVINKRSERIMQKIGMKKINEFDHPNVSKDSPLCKHVLYKIKKG